MTQIQKMRLPIYLDNNATTPTDPRVIDAMLPVFSEHFGNPASTTHSYGWYAEELVEIAREHVASLIGADKDEIIFTSGATEANNLALHGLTSAVSKTNDIRRQCLFAATEHKSVIDPLLELNGNSFNAIEVSVNCFGEIEHTELKRCLTSDVLLVSIMLANNEIGTIQNVKTLCKFVRDFGSFFHCDATQAVGKIPVDVKELGVDTLSFSSHKMYGPKGIGALYIRRSSPRIPLHPIIRGGGHERGLRSGTLNVPAIVGFGKACEIAKKEMDADRSRIEEYTCRLKEKLMSLGEVILNGSEKNRLPGNLNLIIKGVENVKLLSSISSKIAFSLGSACTSASKTPSYVLRSLGLFEADQKCSIRLGIGKFTTIEEIEFASLVFSENIRRIRSGLN